MSDILQDILENIRGHREEAREGMRDLKDTVASCTKILSDSIESNNAVLRRMSDRLVNIEDDSDVTAHVEQSECFILRSTKPQHDGCEAGMFKRRKRRRDIGESQEGNGRWTGDR
ncbi:hypothetical protein LXA43DRAFT_1063232 [Ganoderma leucocontextum]|nr:hypothetical protein LXA43DRAFT_1063232 [Ganoderma leucocontextum]